MHDDGAPTEDVVGNVNTSSASASDAVPTPPQYHLYQPQGEETGQGQETQNPQQQPQQQKQQPTQPQWGNGPGQTPPAPITPIPAVVSEATFSYQLFDCLDDTEVCLDVFFCAPCMLGRTYNAFTMKVPDTMHVPVCCGIVSCEVGAFVVGCILGVWGWFVFLNAGLVATAAIMALGAVPYCVLSFQQRLELRSALGLPTNDIEDCLLVFGCAPCTQCQQTREITKMGLNPGSCMFGARHEAEVQTVQTPQPEQQVVQPAYVPLVT